MSACECVRGCMRVCLCVCLRTWHDTRDYPVINVFHLLHKAYYWDFVQCVLIG